MLHQASSWSHTAHPQNFTNCLPMLGRFVAQTVFQVLYLLTMSVPPATPQVYEPDGFTREQVQQASQAEGGCCCSVLSSPCNALEQLPQPHIASRHLALLSRPAHPSAAGHVDQVVPLGPPD